MNRYSDTLAAWTILCDDQASDYDFDAAMQSVMNTWHNTILAAGARKFPEDNSDDLNDLVSMVFERMLGEACIRGIRTILCKRDLLDSAKRDRIASYLRTTLNNVLTDVLRSRIGRPRRSARASETAAEKAPRVRPKVGSLEDSPYGSDGAAGDSGLTFGDMVKDERPTPEESLMLSEEAESTRRLASNARAFLSRSDAAWAESMRLHIEGLSYQDLSAQLGISAGKARLYISRGRKAMHARFGYEREGALPQRKSVPKSYARSSA